MARTWRLKLLFQLVWIGSLMLPGISARAQESTRTTPSELVGKWCYLNPTINSLDGLTPSCITLNADGSYELSVDLAATPQVTSFPGVVTTDYGTWWVQDNRLYYDSPARGRGSLSLQKANHPRIDNLPMLILNGVAFCSANGNSPW